MKIFRKLLNLLFPVTCGICGKMAETDLCCECKEKFIRETFDHCEVCGKTPACCTCDCVFSGSTRTVINNRKFMVLSFYKGHTDETRVTERMIFALKDKGLFAEFFAEELARAVSAAFRKEGLDLSEWTVTYPPRSAEAFESKGFDQGEEVARRLAKKLGIKCEKTFTRTVFGTVQKSLGAEDRLINVEESMIPMRKKIRHGGKYLVFDDIITTGATMETVAKHLYFCGAALVFPVAIARTESKKSKTGSINF